MEKGLTVFNYGQTEVRTITDEQGEPWWVAKDVCGILGLTDTSQAIERLDDDEKLTRVLYLSGQNREVWTINESGLYCLIIRSNKPEAKRFRKWITSEVLPEIRKTGGYNMPGTYIEALECLIETEKRTVALQQQVEYQTPKVEAFDDLIDSTGLYTLRNAGKALGQKPNLFLSKLRNGRVLYGRNIPYQRMLDQEYFKVKTFVNSSNGFSSNQTYVTPKGLVWLSKKYC